MKELHLICEAHLDPVWLWEWEEGASAAVSTFQSAANLADQFDYIFCHNEVSLYKYIADYAPDLFEKIKQLIKAVYSLSAAGIFSPTPICPRAKALSAMRRSDINISWTISAKTPQPR